MAMYVKITKTCQKWGYRIVFPFQEKASTTLVHDRVYN